MSSSKRIGKYVFFYLLVALVFPLFMSGCIYDAGEISQHTVSGSVSGLNSTGLVLQNNSGDDLSVVGNTFEFATPLLVGSRYEVTILTQPVGQSCSMRNWHGTMSDADITDVTIICRSWGSQEVIENIIMGAGAYGSPDIAVNSSGDAVVVWQHYDGLRYNIWANRYIAGSGWDSAAAELIENDNTGNATSPQIAIDNDGNALAVWQQYDGARDNIWANRYTVGSGWGTAELIQSYATDGNWYPQITVDGNGNALAVWEQRGIGVSGIWANRYTVGGGWGSAEPVTSDTTVSYYQPQIAIDSDGNALAVWRRVGVGNARIWSSRYTPSGGWEDAILIDSTGTKDGYNPQIAIDGNGNALVAWERIDSNGYLSIAANHYTAGSEWGTASLITPNDTTWVLNPQIAVAGSGNAMVVWQQFDDSQYCFNIWSNHYAVGRGWSRAELVENNDVGGAVYPQIAMDNDGNAIAVWEQDDGSTLHIWANHYAAGSGWGSAGAISSGIGGYNPQIAIDGDGNALAVWRQNDGSRYRIYANRYE